MDKITQPNDTIAETDRRLTASWLRFFSRLCNIVNELIAPATTVDNLPTPSAGRRRVVTDANATTFGSVVATGGSNTVPVYGDGDDWRIG